MGNHRTVSLAEGNVTSLRDGQVDLGIELFSNLPEDKAHELLAAAGSTADHASAAVNGFLYQTRDRTVLIDAGGQDLMPGLGALGPALARLGVPSASVDTVFLSHVHPDHIGGLLEGSAPAFPNAQLMLHQDELSFWTSPSLREQLPTEFQPFYDVAQTTLGAYSNQTTVFSGETEVAPGAHTVPLPGHTPGHSGLQIGGADGTFLWGDIVHAEVFQFAVPEACIAFDVDPDAAAATRKDVLARTAAEGVRLCGGHLSGFGRVERLGEAYTFVVET